MICGNLIPFYYSLYSNGGILVIFVRDGFLGLICGILKGLPVLAGEHRCGCAKQSDHFLPMPPNGQGR